MNLCWLIAFFGFTFHAQSESSDCDVGEHVPTRDQWLPTRTCCAWLRSINIKSGKAEHLPITQQDEFTMWGAAQISHMFFDQPYLGGSAQLPNWTRADIDKRVARALAGDFYGETYAGASKLLQDSLHAFGVRGMRGAVVGSETPWVEALLLAAGAVHVTTIEYGAIDTDHPQLSVLTLSGLRELAQSPLGVPQFDFVMTYSSLEHSGLGRYGDVLAPFGDLEWIERIRCLLKPAGIFYFGVPMSSVDCLVWNAHRVYGPHRLAAVERGFRRRLLVGSPATTCDRNVKQPVLILQKASQAVATDLFSKLAIDNARVRRGAWASSVDQLVESYYDTLPTLSQARYSWTNHAGQGHRQFDVLGPVAPHCANLERFGKGDEEKRVCALSKVTDDCVVVSIGSNNQWDFEIDVAERTQCRLVTFDCTCGKLTPPPSVADRITALDVCIGQRNFVNKQGWRFMDWHSALRHANVSHVTHLKMDIEGFEYSVLRDIVIHRLAVAPAQISLELHYQSQMEDISWTKRHKTAGEIALFMLTLFNKGDYFLIDRHDNPFCRHCTELLLARLPRQTKAEFDLQT